MATVSGITLAHVCFSRRRPALPTMAVGRICLLAAIRKPDGAMTSWCGFSLTTTVACN